MATTGEDRYGYTFAATPATINKASLMDIIGTLYLLGLMIMALIEISNTYALSLNQLSIALWAAVAFGAFRYFVLLGFAWGIHKRYVNHRWMEFFLSAVPNDAAHVQARFLDYKQYFKPIRDSAFTYMTFSVITAAIAQQMKYYWSQAQLSLLEQRNYQTFPTGLDFRLYTQWLVLLWVIVLWGLSQIDRFCNAWYTYSDPELTDEVPFNKVVVDLNEISTEGSTQGKKKNRRPRNINNPYAKR